MICFPVAKRSYRPVCVQCFQNPTSCNGSLNTGITKRKSQRGKVIIVRPLTITFKYVQKDWTRGLYNALVVNNVQARDIPRCFKVLHSESRWQPVVPSTELVQNSMNALDKFLLSMLRKSINIIYCWRY